MITCGFARTTSRHVAARAGVTHGLLHHYFPDHDSLLAAAFEKMALEEIDEANEALASDRDPLAHLSQLPGQLRSQPLLPLDGPRELRDVQRVHAREEVQVVQPERGDPD